MAYENFYSSGNLAADRRYAYAQDLFQEQEFLQAIDLFEQILEIAPDWAACWFALGEALERGGEPRRANDAFQRVLILTPDDPFGAQLHLMRLGEVSNVTHAHYVTQLFDQYALRFDTHLVSALNYRGPQIIAEHLEQICSAPHRFEHLIDLGCGTGLMAKALETRFDRASGVDLSPQMIKQAEKTGLYQDLQVGDMNSYLQCLPDNCADLVLAADVFVYCGELAPVFAQVRRTLRPNGIFGFSVQHCAGDGFKLGMDLRFAHSEGYLRNISADNGFRFERLIDVSSRQDKGRDVPGLVCFLN